MLPRPKMLNHRVAENDVERFVGIRYIARRGYYLRKLAFLHLEDVKQSNSRPNRHRAPITCITSDIQNSHFCRQVQYLNAKAIALCPEEPQKGCIHCVNIHSKNPTTPVFLHQDPRRTLRRFQTDIVD